MYHSQWYEILCRLNHLQYLQEKIMLPVIITVAKVIQITAKAFVLDLHVFGLHR